MTEHMNHIERLIMELCPDGVDFKELGECIVKNIGGGTPTKSVTSYWNGDIPWASVGDLSISKMEISSTRNHITNEGLKNSASHIIPKGSVIVAVKISPGKMKITNIDIAINQDLRGLLLHNFLNNRFLVYYFQTINVIGNGTIVKGITVDFLNKIKIPLPPLPIQEEIVKILDKFTELKAELEAELKAELEAREKQYKHYRNNLFTFEEGVEKWKTIGEICIRVSSGGTPLSNNSEYYGGDIPWLRTQEVDWGDIWDTELKISEAGLNNSSAKWIPKNCIIVAMYGATAAKAAINKIALTTNQACCNLEVDNSKANYRYVFHWLCKEYSNLKSLGQGSQSNINGQTIKSYKIPVPPISEQERIVSILDKFDALVNDISISLPAEIKARRQQYEYYRKKILTFKELNK